MKNLKIIIIFILIVSVIGVFLNFMLNSKIKMQMNSPFISEGLLNSRLIPQYFYMALYLLTCGYSIITLIRKKYSKSIMLLLIILIVTSFVFEVSIKNFILEKLR